MLHHINLPTYNQCLERIVQLQQSLIDFICLTPSACSSSPKDDFIHVFPDSTIGAWMFKKLQNKCSQSTYFDTIQQLIKLIEQQPDLRQRIADVYKNDMDYHNRRKEASYDFHFQTELDEKVRSLLKTVFEAFYDPFLYKNGYNTSFVKFKYKDILKQFGDANPLMEVCPACGGRRIRSKTGDHHDCQVDHFFPKSSYPFLSVDAINLVPICTECNGKKHEIDPLDHSLQAPLTQAFHPFDEHALKYIKVIITRKRKGAAGCELQLTEEDGTVSKRIIALNKLIDLESRWNDRLEAEIDSLMRNIRYNATKSRKSRLSAEEIVLDELETMRGDYSEMIGREEHYIVKRCYADFALNNQDERDSLIEYAENERSAASL